MRSSFYCVKLSGPSISPSIGPFLASIASALVHGDEVKAEFRSDALAGDVRRSGKRGSIGSVHGEVFLAYIEREAGTTRIEFVVDDHTASKSPDDVINTAWMFMPGGADDHIEYDRPV